MRVSFWVLTISSSMCLLYLNGPFFPQSQEIFHNAYIEILSMPFAWSSSSMPMTHRFGLLMIAQRPCVFCSCSFLKNLTVLTEWISSVLKPWFSALPLSHCTAEALHLHFYLN